MANESELHFITKMNIEMIEDYYAGKSIDIETDFPEFEDEYFDSSEHWSDKFVALFNFVL